MAKSEQLKRDKQVTREIHRIFWRANFIDWRNLLITYAGRIPSYIALNTLIPLASAFGIKAIIEHDSAAVMRHVIEIAVLGLIYALLTILTVPAISKNAIAGSRYVQNQVFRNYLEKDYSFYTNTYFGALGSKATSLRDAYNEYGELVTQSAPKLLTIIISSLAVIAYNSVPLAVVTLLAMIVVLSFTVATSTYRLRFRRKLSQASAAIAGQVGDALSHASEVKSFATETQEQKRLTVSIDDWADAQYRSWTSNKYPDAVRMLLAAGATAVLLLVSSNLYNSSQISLTIVILIQLYVVRLIATTFEIAEIIKRYEQVMGSAYEPVKTMLIPRTVQDVAQPEKLKSTTKLTISLQAVTYQYDEATTGQRAVEDFNLDIKTGEKVGLVGFSGSGKTTLTKLLLRFMDVTEGRILLGGKDIRNLSQTQLRQLISYVPQEPLLFHRTIAENITYAKPAASREAMLQTAKYAYVDEFVEQLPLGYNTFVGERGVKLSGGQRQRVAIARALLKDSPILVLDEATSALDSESEKYIQKALWKLMEDRTAIVIAHRLSTIQRMDRIAVMDKGRIIQLGTHEELLRDSKGIYAKLWAHQSGGYIGAVDSKNT